MLYFKWPWELIGILKFNFRKWLCGSETAHWQILYVVVPWALHVQVWLNNQLVVNLCWQFLFCVHLLQHFVTETWWKNCECEWQRTDEVLWPAPKCVLHIRFLVGMDRILHLNELCAFINLKRVWFCFISNLRIFSDTFYITKDVLSRRIILGNNCGLCNVTSW
jgi:hypothetical protein